jgi:hypothetical protein
MPCTRRCNRSRGCWSNSDRRSCWSLGIPTRTGRASVLLSPDAAQGQHIRDLRRHGLIGRGIHSSQEPLAIGGDDSGQLHAGRIGPGQVVVLDPSARARVPLGMGRHLRALGRHDSQVVPGGPQGLAHPLEPIEHADRGQDRGRGGRAGVPITTEKSNDRAADPAPRYGLTPSPSLPRWVRQKSN